MNDTKDIFDAKNLGTGLPNFDLDTELELNLDDAFDDSQTDIIDEYANRAVDALVMAMKKYGEVNVDYICQLTQKDKDEVLNELKGIVFKEVHFDKETHKYLTKYVTKDELLSGNLIEKLENLINSSEFPISTLRSNPLLLKNPENALTLLSYDSIEAALPSKVVGNQIFVTLGTPWMPKSYIMKFMVDVLNYPYYYNAEKVIKHDDSTGSWTINGKSFYNYIARTKYGTDHMNAYEILEKTLNLQPIVVKRDVRVYDNKKGHYVWKREPDVIETEAALAKQKAIINAFQNWIWKDPFRKRDLETIYYERFLCKKPRKYDGSFLPFIGMSEKVSLYPYQKDAVARIIFSPNTLLAHDVGSGKTYEMIAAGQELRRYGFSKKNMYVVPNNILKQWEKIYKEMYPNANILIISAKNFRPALRNDTLLRIKDEDFDAIIIPYSYFEMIPLSPDYYINQLNEKYEELRKSYCNGTKDTSTVNRKYAYIRKHYNKLIQELQEKKATQMGKIYFEDLGINRLFVDEAHNFKNVPFETKAESILGLNPTGSNKCQEMMDKVHYVQKTNNGKGVIFATGTPITNSISDVFIIQKYLQDGLLDFLGLSNFDAWINMFAEVSRDFEIDPTCSNYRMASRLSKFHNIPELASILGEIADFHHIDKASELPDFNGYIDTKVEKTKELESYLLDISKRADEIRSHHPRLISSENDEVKKYDNMLVITTDGRKAALDLRLIDSNKYFYNEDSKVYHCAKNVYDIYTKYNSIKATQLIFSDVSTPKEGFNIYDSLKEQLMDFGIPGNEIEYIHNANSDKARTELFKKVQKGEIRILIGSTFKLGIGVNVQNKLIAIHHIDIPWRPADMIQREGRILRPGNTNKEVFIYRYITEHSFDAYSWQLLETKQNFISKLLNNNILDRDATDVDNTVLNYAEVKALAIGNPLIKKRVETANKLARTNLLSIQYQESIKKTKDQVLYFQNDNIKLQERINNCIDDCQYYKTQIDKINQLTIEERKEIAKTIYSGLLKTQTTGIEDVITNYFGFDISGSAITTEENKKFLYIKRKGIYRVEYKDSDIGTLTRIDNFLSKMDGYIDTLKDNLKQHEDYISIAQNEFEKPNPYDKMIQNYIKELNDIDIKLGVK